MTASQGCNILEKTQLLFLEGNSHLWMGQSILPRSHEKTNIKNKVRKTNKKNKGKCLHSCSGMSAWSTNYFHSKHRKNLCRVIETGEQTSSASKPRQL